MQASLSANGTAKQLALPLNCRQAVKKSCQLLLNSCLVADEACMVVLIIQPIGSTNKK
jgi:hypothetical protein